MSGGGDTPLKTLFAIRNPGTSQYVPGKISEKNGETVFKYLAGEGFENYALLVDTEGQITKLDGKAVEGDWIGLTKMVLAQEGYDNIAAVETEVGNHQIGQVIPKWEEYELLPRE